MTTAEWDPFADETHVRLGLEELIAITPQSGIVRRSLAEEWVVPDLISTSISLVYGEPFAGKTTLMGGLLVALTKGTPWLGKAPLRTYRPLVLWSDAECQDEYFEHTGCDRSLNIGHSRANRELEWDRVLPSMQHRGYDFLLVDNLMGVASGPINDDDPIGAFFEILKDINTHGIPVVVVHHSSDKTYQGFKAKTALGHTNISANTRINLFCERLEKTDGIRVRVKGNRTSTATYEVDRASLTVRGSSSMSRERMDRNVEIADFIAEHCTGSIRAVASDVAKEFGKSEHTWRGALGNGKSNYLRSLVEPVGDGSWRRIGVDD